MLICGAKITHDGGVALLDRGRLVFSVEMEKVDNNLRHTSLTDLSVAFDLCRDFGYDPADLDVLVLDGWRKTSKLRFWHGQEVALQLAPYRRGVRSADLLTPTVGSLLDMSYVSFPHYAGHAASAVCTSPAVRAGDDTYVLCWDGAMFPFLYHWSSELRTLRTVGPAFFMLGDTYHELSQRFEPFAEPMEWPHTLALPGKIMAYVAKGAPDDAVLAHLADSYERARQSVLPKTVPDDSAQERAGRLILERMRAETFPASSPEDGLASIHQFLGEMLLNGVDTLIREDGRRSPNIALVGGCALNIKWNAAVRSELGLDSVWVPPFPNDAGSALGTAACAHIVFGEGPVALDWDVYAGPALVPSAPPPGWTETECGVAELAALLHEEQTPVVFLQGRAELGPRALGHRSILAPATDRGMKDLLNEVKGREAYRPVAPLCLEEAAADVFDPGTPDPYMLFEHRVRDRWRDVVPAVCHIDGSARVQTVNERQEPVLTALLREYRRISGIPLLCNTSANLNGRGFFPDAASAAGWGRVRHIWNEGRLWTQ